MLAIFSPHGRRRTKQIRSARRRGRIEFLENRQLLAAWSGDVFDPAPGTPLWTNTEVQQITGDVHVPSGKTLTIQPGTVVQFNSGTNLTVDGTLIALGSAGETIILTSYRDNSPTGGADNAGAGDWGAITFNAGSSASVLDHAEVRYGGYSGGNLAAEVIDSGPLTLTNSVLRDSYNAGLRIIGSTPTLSGVTFQDNLDAAVSMDLAAQPAINNVTLTNNFLNGVRLDGGDLSAAATAWDNPDIVYRLSGDITVPVGKTLTIGAGQIIKTKDTNVVVNGTLTATGTAAQPIVITSYRDDSAGGDTNNNGASAGGAGDWGEITFNPGSDASNLDHMIIRYGGYVSGNPPTGAAVVVGANIAISNTTISDSWCGGMRINSSSPTLTNDTWQDNNALSATAAVSMDLASSPVITAPTVHGNTFNAVVVGSGSITGNVKWNGPDMFFRLSGDVTVETGASLEIASGQGVQFNNTSLTVNGTLTAVGTAEDPVTFTSYRDNSPLGGADSAFDGDWGAIVFNPGSDASNLDHVVVRYGGYAGDTVAAGVVIAADVTVSNSTFKNNYNGGVRVINSSPTLSDDTWQDHTERFDAPAYAISMDLASSPVITNPTLLMNDFNGVLLDGGDVPNSIAWHNPDIVYGLSNNITVPAGVTLTVAAGQIIKALGNHAFGLGVTSLLVNGALQAAGTTTSPIIFTSYRDETAGGDTDNYFSLTPAAPGDWGAIRFGSGSTGNLMDHTEVRYGGFFDAPNDPGAIMVAGSLTLSNSIVRHAGYSGVVASPGSTATLTNNLIVRNHIAGIQAQAGATLTAVNNTIDGTDYYGVLLESPTATLINNLITNSGSIGVYQTGPTALTMRFNDVFNPGFLSTNYSGLNDQTGTNGNLSVDPKYFNRFNLNYQLRPGSPVEDAGTDNGAPATDLFGNPHFDDPNISGRGDGSEYDLGAIEVQEVATSNIDLAATAVSGPATGLQDQMVTVDWTITNVGTEAATGSWHDAVYLASSTVLTPDAILLGEFQHSGDLGPEQSYNGSGNFTLPGVLPGNYHFLIRTNNRNEVFEARALANNVTASSATVAMDLPELMLGTPLNSSLPATGAAKFYKLAATAGADLQVQLTGSGSAVNELYVSFGDAPSRQAFDERSITPNSANQFVAVSSTKSGNYYIEVFGADVPSAENFTLTASQASFGVGSVTPAQGGNTGQVTVTITGAQFDGNTTAKLIDSGGGTINATKVHYLDSGHIAATFDLTGRPTGAADVQVVNTGNQTTTLADGFTIIAGQGGRLVASVSAPSAVRQGRGFAVNVEYTNEGDADLLAPVLAVQGSDQGQVSFFLDLHDAANALDIIAVNPSGPAGILPPGAHGRITLYSSSASTVTLNYQLAQAGYANVPIPWTEIGAAIRPSGLSDADWNTLFTGLQNNMGTTWDRFQGALSADATLLPAGFGLNYSLTDVLQMEVDKALPQPDASVSGRLFLADTAHPLGGVEIRLEDASTGEAVGAVSFTDGTFHFASVPPGTYTVRFDGYVSVSPTELTVGAASQSDLSLVATPGGTIAGSVSLSPDGSPVRQVVLFATSDLLESFATQTDSDGRYAFTSLPAGNYTVRTAAGQYRGAVVSNVELALGEIAQHINLAVQTAGSIRGKVTGPTGAVAGATVVATDANGNGHSAVTTSTGDYTITGLAAQAYTVRAGASGLASAEVAGVNVSAGGSVDGVNLTLTTAGSITGAVTSDGSPVAGVVVSAVNGAAAFSARSGADGGFSLVGLSPGTYQVTTGHGAFMTATVAGVAVTAGNATNLVLPVVSLGSITGTVTNATTNLPLPNVVVTAATSAGFSISAVSDASGHFAMIDLDAGVYRVALSDSVGPAVTSTQVTLSSASRTADVNLSAPVAGTVSGAVFAADGSTPLAGALVALLEDGNRILTMSTDAAGHYSFVALAVDTYAVEAVADGLTFPARTNISLSGGAVVAGQDFVAGSDVIRGAVQDAATQFAIADADIRITRLDGVVSLRSVAGLSTAEDGSYEFTGALPGMYRVTVLAPGYAVSTQTINVTSDVASAADFSLAAGSLIRGVVRDSASGEPLAAAGVVLTGEAGSLVSFAAITDAQGNYEFGELPAGTYSLAVDADDHETAVIQGIGVGAAATQAQNVGLDAATIELSGTVQNAAGPVPGAYVLAIDPSGAAVSSAVTASDGTYTLGTLSPGTFSIAVSAVGHQAVAAVSRTVARGDSLTNVDFNLVAAALVDPPETFEAAGESSSERFYDPLFSAPQRAANEPVSYTVVCHSVVINNGDSARENVAAAYRDWNDYYEVAEPLRRNLLRVFESAADNLNLLEKSFQDIKSTLDGVKDAVAATAKASKSKAVQGLIAVFGSADTEKINELDESLSKINPYFEKVLGKVDDMRQDVTTLLTVNTSGGGAFNVAEASVHFNDTATLMSALNTALTSASTYVEGDAQIAPYLNLSIVKDKFKSLQQSLFAAQSAADALKASATTLQIAYFASSELTRRQIEYENAVYDANATKKRLLSEKCKDVVVAPQPTTTAGALLVFGFPQVRSVNELLPLVAAAPIRFLGASTTVGVFTSLDPNDLIGPAGFGPQHFLQPGTLPYEIHFENDPAKATAAAQIVTIANPLDADLDLSTFQFTGFGFGSHNYTVPPGLSHYETTLDLRPDGVNLLVPVTLDLNMTTGEVTARYESLDPLTRLAPDGINDGFLPIDNANHDGQGYITYSVATRSGLATGTTVNNQASIVFDTNEPLETPVFTNTIDEGGPTSAVAALPSNSPAIFTVDWSGADDAGGSEVAYYDVLVSVDGGPFTLWQSATGATSAQYSGEVGKSYRFYSVATDHVGLIEPPPATFDAETTVAEISWRNLADPSDVDGSGGAPGIPDLIAIVTHLRTFGIPHILPAPSVDLAPPPFVDVDGNGQADLQDLLAVVQVLRSQIGAAGEFSPEGEFSLAEENLPGLFPAVVSPAPTHVLYEDKPMEQMIARAPGAAPEAAMHDALFASIASEESLPARSESANLREFLANAPGIDLLAITRLQIDEAKRR